MLAVVRSQSKYALIALLTMIPIHTSNARDLARELSEHPLYRSGKCFSISSMQPVEIPARTPQNYEIHRQITKVDIACIADDIRIDQPIYTWGGDITIFATKVEVNAPIDVRPYFVQLGSFDRFQAAYRNEFQELLEPPKIDEWNWPPSRENYLRMSNEHYATCQGCIAAGSDVIGPQFPPGLTVANIVGPGTSRDRYIANLKPGLPPLQITSPTASKSGSVTIIAREIQFSEHLNGAFAPQEVCDKPIGDTFAINASGVRGGRGGVGALGSCQGSRGSGPFSCSDFLHQNRTPSGPGGDGGEGGAISIVRLGAEVDENFIADVSRSTTVAGGLPGPRTLFILPRSPGGNAGDIPYVPMCQRATGNFAPSGRSGRDGVLTFSSLSTVDGLALMYKALSARDARSDYLFDELAKRSIESKFIFADSHIAYFDRVIAEAVLHGFARIASQIHADAVGSSAGLPFDDWQSLAGVTPEALSSQIAIAPSTYQVLRDWPLVDNATQGSPAEFFLRSGGFLNLDDEQAFGRFLAEAARIDLGKQLELSAEQLGELTRIKGLAAETMLFDRETKIRERLEKLEESLVAMEQQLANAPSDGMEGLLKSISDARAPVSALIAALTAGDVGAIIGTVGPASTAIGRVYGSLHTAAPKASSIPELKNAIASTTKLLEEFLEAAAQIRSRNTRSEEYAAFRALRERGALRSKLNGRIAMMPDLLKLSILTYAADPVNSTQTLASNAQAVWTFARRFPDEEPVFRLRPGPNACGRLGSWDLKRNMGRCGVIRGPERQTLFLVTGDPFLDNLPALVLDDSPNRTVVFDTLGYRFNSSEEGPPLRGSAGLKLMQRDQ